MNKKINLLMLLIFCLFIDLLTFQSIVELFGPSPPIITIEFSNTILQSQELIKSILILFVIKNFFFTIYAIINRNYWLLLFSPLVIAILYFQIQQIESLGLSDIGAILYYFEGLSYNIKDQSVWGLYVTERQVESFLVWLCLGILANLCMIAVNYLVAKDIYRSTAGVERDEIKNGSKSDSKIPNRIRLIASITYALSFLAALLEYAKYSIYIVVAIYMVNILIIAIDLISPHIEPKNAEISSLHSQKARKPFTLKQMKLITVILFGGFLLLFGVPWFYAVFRYASLQHGEFGEWSFYLWSAIIILVSYIILIIKEPSIVLIKIFRLISKIIFLFAAVNLILNISDTQYFFLWFFIISIGHYLVGGVHISDGYYTIPHFYGFIWALLIFSALNIILTRDAKFHFKIKELRSKITALKDQIKRKLKINGIKESIQNKPVEALFVFILLISLGSFIASIDNYGQDIIIKKHPTVITRLNFWAGGTYIPPEYLEVIKSHNLKYNTTTTLYCFGNEYVYREGGQFLIDIPGAKYQFQYSNGTVFYLNATETLNYMQSLIDARIEFYQAVHGMESVYPALSVLNSTTINATFRDRFNILFQGFMFDIEAGGNYGSFNRTMIEEKQMYKAKIVKYVHEAGKKVGYTTVAYTIGDWLDGDNDVSTLYRIFDFYPSSLNPAFQNFYYDKFNWMIYRTDQPGRNLNPYFSYLHFKEAKIYMDKMQNMYPELNIDSDTNFGISIGWTTPDRKDQFSHHTEGPKNILLEAQIANSLGISEVVLFYLPTFLNYYSAEQYAWILEELNKEWTIKIEFDRFHGILGPPFATLWDIPNFTGTRFIYHLMDFWLNSWFGVYVLLITLAIFFALAVNSLRTSKIT